MAKVTHKSGWFAPPKTPGGFKIRLCPGRKGGQFVAKTRTHRIGEKIFHCHREFDATTNKWVGKCVACDYYAAAWQTAQNPTLHGVGQHVQAIKPVERYYFNIIARDQEEKGPLIWSCGKTLYATILEGIVGNSMNINVPALGDVTHPKTGHDLLVNMQLVQMGGSQVPNFAGSQFMPTSKLGTPAQVKKWMGELWDIDTIRVLRSEDDMKDALKVWLGLDPKPGVKGKRVYRNINDPFEPGW